MNRPIRHVIAVLLGCFTILFAQLNRVQVYDAAGLQGNAANTRTIQRDFNRPRGIISTADGVVVAESIDTPGGIFDRQRVYPQGDLYSHTVGYTSFTFGADGVERTYNDALVGRTASQELTGLTEILDGRNPTGNVVLTLDHRMQTLAKEQLGRREGSVVALDPRSGAVYAMWSYPSFDPNGLATNDGTVANGAWTELVEAEGLPLRPRAYRDREFPGSTFKLVTAAAALESGAATMEQPSFEPTDAYTPPLTERALTNFGGSTCGGNLTELVVVSCNTGFGRLAAELVGPGPLIDQAQRFGFNQQPPIDLPNPATSVFPTDFGSLVSNPSDVIPAGVFENTPALAQSAIGQFEVQASPLQMALVAAAVSNGGTVPTPHVVDRVEDSVTLSTVSEVSPGRWLNAMSEQNATALATAMVETVERGTATSVAVPGVVVGAKTGTAQLGTDPPRSHAWIVVFAGRPEGPPEIAIAVLVEGQEGSSDQTGGGTAGPIARSLLEQFFR
jgi:peptidoglycan glycosyltransferase